MNNVFFEKTIENVRKHRDITIAAAGARKNYLESKTNYHNTNFISENILEMKMKRTQIFMNKLAYLGLSILEISTIVMYDYAKPKYE